MTKIVFNNLIDTATGKRVEVDVDDANIQELENVRRQAGDCGREFGRRFKEMSNQEAQSDD